MTSANRELVKLELMRDEGVKLTVYKDSLGIETIGVGRNLRDKGITHDEAQFLLENDLDECIADCLTFPWFADLDPVRQRVIVNMRFNLGPSKLRAFKNTLGYVQRGEYLLAAEGMLASRWARQVGARAIRLAKMMETGRD
jgi:lysozyme